MYHQVEQPSHTTATTALLPTETRSYPQSRFETRYRNIAESTTCWVWHGAPSLRRGPFCREALWGPARGPGARRPLPPRHLMGTTDPRHTRSSPRMQGTAPPLSLFGSRCNRWLDLHNDPPHTNTVDIHCRAHCKKGAICVCEIHNGRNATTNR